MDNEKLEQMTIGEVALGYTTILQDIVEQLLIKMVEKNVINELEASELIRECIDKQQKNIASIENDMNVIDKERLLRIYELAIERWSVAKEDLSV